MTIVERVRRALNITSTAFDGELYDVVEAARSEMELSGVPASVCHDDANADVVQAIKLYVKADQSWENPSISARQMESFNALCNKLALTHGREETEE